MARATGAVRELSSLDHMGLVGQLGQRAQPVVLARELLLPVLPAFEGLLPESGLRRGTVTRVHGPGATSLALALVAGCTRVGSWVAAIGVRGLGLGAAGELGLALEHLLLVDVPTPPQWATTVSAALDGVDVVLAEVPPRCREADARRLQARLRDRGAVVVLVGWAGAFQPDLVVAGSSQPPSSWQGMGVGWGRLRARCLSVEVTGRRGASRSRTGRLWLPAADGEVRLEPEGSTAREVVVAIHQGATAGEWPERPRAGVDERSEWPERPRAGVDERSEWPERPRAGVDERSEWPERPRAGVDERSEWPERPRAGVGGSR